MLAQTLPQSLLRRLAAGASLLALAGCVSGNMDMDLRKYSKLGFDTSSAAAQATNNRPNADARGVISYPTYQVAVARDGDTVAVMAQRLGIDPAALASKNALSPTTRLGKGEVLVLPAMLSQPSAPKAESVEITTLAGSAIDRAESTVTPIVAKPSANDPIQHRVARGETAYSIARYYNVNVRALADWNGLAQDLSVREGQLLIIPTASASAKAAATSATSAPGEGSATPTPPSATKPLPDEKTAAASAAKPNAAPDMSAGVTKASGQMQMPVSGAIIRPYAKGKNDGIDIASSAGTPVKAAAAGTVAAITKDTEQVPILVLRHEGGLLSVYANLEGITVAKGDKVTKGQAIAKVRAATPASLHFEVRKGFESVDPMPYLQ